MQADGSPRGSHLNRSRRLALIAKRTPYSDEQPCMTGMLNSINQADLLTE